MSRRIVVLGLPGSGKTTYAKKLAEKEGIPHIEGDSLYWKGDTPLTLEEFRKIVKEKIQSDSWVYEGHFGKVKNLLKERATEFVILETSTIKSFFRMLRRDVIRTLLNPSHFSRLYFNIRHWPELVERSKANKQA